VAHDQYRGRRGAPPQRLERASPTQAVQEPAGCSAEPRQHVQLETTGCIMNLTSIESAV